MAIISPEHFHKISEDSPKGPIKQEISSIEKLGKLGEYATTLLQEKKASDLMKLKRIEDSPHLRYGKDRDKILIAKEPEPWGVKKTWRDMTQPYWKDLELNSDLIGSDMTQIDADKLGLPKSETAKKIPHKWTEDNVATKLELENRSVEEIAWTTGKMKKDGEWVEADRSITEPVKAWLDKKKLERKERRLNRRNDRELKADLKKPLPDINQGSSLASVDDMAVSVEDSIIPPDKFSKETESIGDKIKKGFAAESKIKRAWNIGKQAKKSLSPDDPGHKFAKYMYKGNVPMKGTKLGPVRNIMNIAKDDALSSLKALAPQKGKIQKPAMQALKAIPNLGKGGLKALFAGGEAGLLAGMGPAGWAMMALSILGGKLFKSHTLLGKIFSDEALKEDIVYIGKSPSGIPMHEFKYKGMEGRFSGVLSKSVPWASSKHPTGYNMVDYSMIDVPFKRIG